MVREAEYHLIRSGRHSYVYVPRFGEDYEATAEHLLKAGIIVLLVLPEGKKLSEVEAARWSDICGSQEATAENIASVILQRTMLDNVMAAGNWSI